MSLYSPTPGDNTVALTKRQPEELEPLELFELGKPTGHVMNETRAFASCGAFTQT